MKKYPIVALIYDFDGTLSPGNMQEFGFIEAIGKKPQEFWQESDDIAIGQDASNILSYMKLMFELICNGGAFNHFCQAGRINVMLHLDTL